MASLADVYSDLERHIWFTKNSRFNAAWRYSTKQACSVFTLAVLSIYNMCLSFPTLLGYTTQTQATNLTFMSVIVSAFVLAISLFEIARSYDLKSERLHQNAIALNELHAQVTLAQAANPQASDVRSHMDKYYELVKLCPENHSGCDFNHFRAQHSAHFGIHRGWCAWYKINYYLSVYWLYALLLILPLVVYLYSLK